MEGLVAGALRVGEAAGVDVRLVRVPGSVELAVAAEAAAQKGVDGIVALGVVVRGETPHFDYVCQAATHGLNDVALRHTVPVGFGVLTVDNEQQADRKSGVEGSKEDKGAEAVEAGLVTAGGRDERR